ncbi:hypothetical protein NDU88_003542 [Pleurodeles waltl]|uniref:Uncharacterized protein n=1 Tax=Pleurodeles waltl TaxID=8319 RepID=A0AAV7M3P0_PLEWA|nr:hypothetical protein NDU88_003542 [Pleurodeles waltl]
MRPRRSLSTRTKSRTLGIPVTRPQGCHNSSHCLRLMADRSNDSSVAPDVPGSRPAQGQMFDLRGTLAISIQGSAECTGSKRLCAHRCNSAPSVLEPRTARNHCQDPESEALVARQGPPGATNFWPQ